MTAHPQSFIYRHPRIYNTAMRLLYGTHYAARFRVIADLIDERSTVVDLCCGPPVLYADYLRKKSVQYTGIDVNARFIHELARCGARGLVVDLQSAPPLPQADYVLMQASLYHFLPDPSALVQRMLESARKHVIVSEPIRNLSTSRVPFVASFARHQTDPGSGQHTSRFDATSLEGFFRKYASLIERSFLTPGSREKIYVLRGQCTDS